MWSASVAAVLNPCASAMTSVWSPLLTAAHIAELSLNAVVKAFPWRLCSHACAADTHDDGTVTDVPVPALEGCAATDVGAPALACPLGLLQLAKVIARVAAETVLDRMMRVVFPNENLPALGPRY
jgi:hypothetical protein